jgi:hypothetical protein
MAKTVSTDSYYDEITTQTAGEDRPERECDETEADA